VSTGGKKPASVPAAVDGLAAKLATARLPERTVELCLRGDLQADYEELERQLSAATDRPDDGRIVGNVDVRRIALDMDALRVQMADSVQVFRLRAFRRGRWTALLADHPADEGDERGYGYNPETFAPAAVIESVIEPAGISEETWEQLFDSITDSQFNQMYSVAQILNQRPVSIPFSKAASALTRGSDSE
jgi:hypothetical protein